MTAAGNVLVVDDDIKSAGQIRDVLDRMGYAVYVFDDPEDCIKRAGELFPDIIFANLLMPGTNGLKVSKALHSVSGLERVPVIMLISHAGELDPKYTAPIGIVDVLVKPLKESEIVEKTESVLRRDPLSGREMESLREISLETEMSAAYVNEEPELAGSQEYDIANEPAFAPGEAEILKDNKKETADEITEGEAYMKDKGNLFDEKDDDERALFSEEPDIFGEELKKSRAERGKGDHEEALPEEGFTDDEAESFHEEETQASPIRRIILIAASIVVGIVLGIGSYMFFTTGSRQQTEKQMVRAAPEQAPAPPVPAIPSDKPNVIPELPVKTEPKTAESDKPEPEKARQAKQEPVKAAAEPPQKEDVVRPDDKKVAAGKKAVSKPAATSSRGKKIYYVQAGLFEGEKNAESLSEKLKKMGYPSAIKKIVTSDKKTMYRVTAGSYGGFNKAVQVSEALNRQGIRTIVHKQ